MASEQSEVERYIQSTHNAHLKLHQLKCSNQLPIVSGMDIILKFSLVYTMMGSRCRVISFSFHFHLNIYLRSDSSHGILFRLFIFRKERATTKRSSSFFISLKLFYDCARTKKVFEWLIWGAFEAAVDAFFLFVWPPRRKIIQKYLQKYNMVI